MKTAAILAFLMFSVSGAYAEDAATPGTTEHSKIASVNYVAGALQAAKDYTDTKALTHVQTGNLRRNWTHDVRGEGDNIIGVVGTNVPYAPYEDEYHGNVSTALNDNYDKYMKIIANEISKG